MQNKRPTILAINPGTRYLAVAVLKGPFLADWRIFVLTGDQREKLAKAGRLIGKLITDHSPDLLALKKLHRSRCSKPLERLDRALRNLARSRSVATSEHSIQEIEVFLLSDERPNKRKLSQAVCQCHPILNHNYNREENNLNPYYTRVFEAVALAMVAQSTVGNQSS